MQSDVTFANMDSPLAYGNNLLIMRPVYRSIYSAISFRAFPGFSSLLTQHQKSAAY
ncbi:hypothetical protein EVAR_72831_1, partial [Eumeta japonica]